MTIIIDIGHPAQVHNFKYVYWELINRGHIVLFVAKEKEMTKYLLEKYKLNFVILGNNKKKIINKVLYLVFDLIKFTKLVLYYKPDLIVSRMSIHCSLVANLMRVHHIALADTEKSFNLSFFPNTIITAYSFKKDFGRKHLRYSGNIELFYLHSKRFRPDKSILDILNIPKDEKYAIVRFVSWDAHHDVGQKGLSNNQKIALIKLLSKKLKVFITSEKGIPSTLEKYKLEIPAEKIHDALFYSSMYIGEGGTMASEAALLGVPSIYINSLNTGYIQEEIRAGLIYRFTDGNEAINKVKELIDASNTDDYIKLNRKFLIDKIDVTAFFVWFLEEYPQSLDIMRSNPEYQIRFK